MSADVDRAFCSHCGERLPRFGGGLGYCSACASRYRGIVRSNGRSRTSKDPVLAGLLSFVLPGGGQLYTGHWLLAVLVFVTSPFVLPWLLGIVHACWAANRINARLESEPSLAAAA